METRAPQGFVPLVAAVEPRVKRGSTATELPKSKAIEPTERTDSTRRSADGQEAEQRAENLAALDEDGRRSEVDIKTHAATGSLVLQALDASTGEVLHQFPNNATLKSRAIARYESVQGAPSIRRTI